MEFKSPALAAVWPHVKQLLNEGFSIIPVREKQEGERPAKSPYTGWKKYQTGHITEKELWEQMGERYYTNAIAVICGLVSGNLEVIDIDNKNKPGVEALVFKYIQDSFPDIWEQLRIHKSPSGGFHILYKVSGGQVPGNKKLASRPPVNGEGEKPLCFLETRGEGGYVLLPPSLGYSIYKDASIPTITWEQRCDVIAICQSFNEIIKPDEKPREAKVDDYYDVNPFEHFNKSSEGERILEQFGWKYKEENTKFIWFTRPGTQSSNIHAAFLRDRRLFYFFTTNSEFETERCYQPSTVLSKLLHNDNKKTTYQELVKKGYGQIKQSVEQRMVSKAKAESQVPANMSEAGKTALETAKNVIKQKYPYGIFWEIDEKGKIDILREEFYIAAAGLGFRFDEAMQTVVYIKENRIYKITDRFFYDNMKDYIKSDNDVLSAYENFLQKSGKFSKERIQLLDETNILVDTRKVCYKFYEDIFVKITAYDIEEHTYDELGSKLIWADQVQSRKLRIGDSGKYVDFLEKSIEYNIRKGYIDSVIGYLAHNYKDDSTAYFPILVEQCEDPRHGGGSGKNIFCKLFEHITTVTGVPGEQIKYDEKVFQSWQGERLFVISDAPKDFKFIFFKELTSGSGKVKKLFKDESVIPVHRMPKLIVQTNYGVDVVDGGLKRRIVQIEFTDFFTKAKGVDVYYKCHFPTGWTEEDWAGYDGTMLRAVQKWLHDDLKIDAVELTETGWKKQFEQTHGRTAYEFINDKLEQFIMMGQVKNDEFKKMLTDFCDERNISRNYQPTSFRLNKALQDYCRHYNIIFEFDVKIRENGIQFKGKVFKTNVPF